MKSNINRAGLLAVALGAVGLAGCDSIKDVRSEPSTVLPPEKVVVQGTISGLGSRRPIRLRNDSGSGVATREFFGNFNQPVSPFSFGAYNEGTPYNITVQAQPFGKICTVSNGSGTAGDAAAAPITVSCENDPAVERYPLTVDTTAGAGLPNFKVTLTTEDGVREMDATGQTSVTFEDAIFNSQLSLPVFGYKVAATTETTEDGVTTTHNCAFARIPAQVFLAQTFSIGGRNVDANEQSIPTTGPATVAVDSCEFTVTANVQYSGTPAQAMPAGGMQLALRNNLTGVDEQTLEVSAYSATNLSFPIPVRSNARAIYELVVSRQPAGQHCVVSGTVTFFSMIVNTVSGSTLTVPTGSAVLLVDPDNPQWWAYTGRNVRCRAIPGPESQLTGTYQVDRPLRAANSTSTAEPARPRLFLTFFADGTFLNAVNHTRISTCSDLAMFPPSPPTTSCDGPEDLGRVVNINLFNSNLNTSGGVVHGFYDYDPDAGTITFTAFTASNINPSNFGLNGMPGYTTAAGVGSVTATNVVKTAPPTSKLSLRFSGNRPGQSLGSPPGAAAVEVWSMTEPDSRPGELTGTWVSEDHRRIFAYNDNETFGIHIGVNGLPNLQDTCYIVDDFSTQAGGKFARHSGSSGFCSPGGEGFGRDLPFFQFGGTSQSAPHEPPGLNSRFPGSRAQYDLRPTPPNTFTVTPGVGGAPDTLTTQATQNNGAPDGMPATFIRERAN